MYPLFTASPDRKVASSFVSYDTYLDNGEPYEEECKGLEEMATTPGMMVVNAPSSVISLPGELNTFAKYTVGTEQGKKASRTMLKGIWRNDLRGHSFADFDISNIVVTPSGKAKFKGVEILPKSEEQTRRNYLSAEAIIRFVFTLDDKVPLDIEHLLHMIMFKPEKADLYHIHACWIPHPIRSSLYIKLYEQVKDKVDSVTKNSILESLPYVDYWEGRVYGNDLLMKTYSYRGGVGYMVSMPQVLPGNNALTYLQLRDFRLRKFLDFLRHRIAHKMEGVNGNGTGTGVNFSYTSSQSDMVCHVHYPLIEAHLQEELFDRNVIDELNIEDMF